MGNTLGVKNFADHLTKEKCWWEVAELLRGVGGEFGETGFRTSHLAARMRNKLGPRVPNIPRRGQTAVMGEINRSIEKMSLGDTCTGSVKQPEVAKTRGMGHVGPPGSDAPTSATNVAKGGSNKLAMTMVDRSVKGLELGGWGTPPG